MRPALAAVGIACLSGLSSPTHAAGQAGPEEVVVEGSRLRDIERLPAVRGTELYAGKKNEVISVAALDADVAQKNARQIFSKVPGVFVYDMDGAGNQLNIATRGLDPHRGWEFNIRKDGYITNSDMYAYPASHFTLPMEAVERIELTRGTAALQYGAQFGGMLNYVTKRAAPGNGIGFESVNSAGSYGLLSTYNAISARHGRTDLRLDYNKRVSDGYRDAGESDAEYYSISVHHGLGDGLKLDLGYARSKYRFQLPGPLTDAMFSENPRQATRTRNYYSPDIEVPSFGLEWAPSERVTVSWKTSGVFGERNSVLFDRPADVVDGVIPGTGLPASRQVDVDDYHSVTSAAKVLLRYTLGGRPQAFLAGVEVMANDTHRRQQGVGSTGGGYDLGLVQPGWGRDLRLKSDNVAFFAENTFAPTDRWKVSPGFRVESGDSRLSGVITGYAPGELSNTITHDFTLLGVTTEFALDAHSNVYAGWAQSYRPVIFKDIIPSSPLERVDKNLEDARGHTTEIGYRGANGGMTWDVSAFRMTYRNRLGTSAQFDGTNFYNLRTNVGDSETRGVEVFLEYGRELRGGLHASLYTASAWMDAEYEDATVRVGTRNVDVDGNAVQSVPKWISRSGVALRKGAAGATLLYSYTGASFADALNTLAPSANGAVGRVPAYGILDLAGTYVLNSTLTLRASVTNLTDRSYFTKRPEFYPGPGIWPSDGRALQVSFSVALNR